ncbi:MAG TPA: ArsA-related P-loop ATPase [bacterium]|nr:ArsA-related P-loop ATPase [bacterium]
MDKPVGTPKILLLCGCGGVGKTSIAAAMAFLCALHGKNTLAFTVDPARRLADTLGMRLDQSLPEIIPLGAFETDRTGVFSALMFNVDHAAKELVMRYADSRDRAQKIMDNPVFRLAVRQITGTEEYLALGKLFQVLTDWPSDLIVVDTAPSRHALDFLKGPENLLKILDPAAMKRLKSPVKRFIANGKITGAGPGSILGRIALRIAGGDTVDAAVDLASHLSTMYSGFKDRVHHLHQILRDPNQTRILLVTTPSPTALADAGTIHGELLDAGYRPEAVVFNRVTPYLLKDSQSGTALREPLDVSPRSSKPPPQNLDRLIREMPEFIRTYRTRVDNEIIQMNRFLRRLPGTIPNIRIPLLPGDINSLNDLSLLHPYLADWI